MRPPVARLIAALVYLFVTALVYLAGIYVGRVFYLLYALLVALPVVSLVQALLTLVGLRYYQDFDTEHPVKGQTIGYRLTIANEVPLASCNVRIRFMAIHPDLRTSINALSVVFRGRSTLRRDYQISCPYRGIYTVGMESLEASDLLGWTGFRRPVYHRTFYVFPRIVEIDPPITGNRSRGLSSVSRSGRESDYALFEGLTDYRAGQPVRHIAWKKLAATGHPFLRVFGRSSQPGITIYLDMRRQAAPDAAELEAEDCSIEIAVSLVKSFLDNRIPTTLKAMGRELYLFKGSDPDSFARFYRDTINLVFQKTISPADLFAADRKVSEAEGAVLLITHIADPEILELAETGEEGSVALIVNQTSMSGATRSRLRNYYAGLGEPEGRIFLVDGPESIREDLR